MPSEQEYIVLFNALLSSTPKAYSFPIDLRSTATAIVDQGTLLR